ncbi:MAG: spondin domain-containing protein [Armatimonadota bacterium]
MSFRSAALVVALVLSAVLPVGLDTQAAPGTVTYRVTLLNLTTGQPFSPPVAATHQKTIRMFEVGRLASDQLAAIAVDGDQIPMFNLFNGSSRVTQVVDIGRPLTPRGIVRGTFTDSVTFDIIARPGDKLSLATMLICTNDGFLGLDAVNLPQTGAEAFLLNGYDAGRENNTEQSQDIVDPCSGLGPVMLAGDPDGNNDASVVTVPRQRIHHHPNIQGVGDLFRDIHGWIDPVAVVVVVKL